MTNYKFQYKIKNYETKPYEIPLPKEGTLEPKWSEDWDKNLNVNIIVDKNGDIVGANGPVIWSSPPLIKTHPEDSSDYAIITKILEIKN